MNSLELNETNPFQSRGFNIEKHVSLSPTQKENILKKENVVYGPRRYILKDNKKRTIHVYKHENEYYGRVEHRTETNHPSDVNIYLLKQKRLKKKMNKSESIIEQISDIIDERSGGIYHVSVSDDKGNIVTKAHAKNGNEITSVLHRAADHLKNPNQQLKARVHDTAKNRDYKHIISRDAAGKPTVSGSSVNSYAKNESTDEISEQYILSASKHSGSQVLKAKANTLSRVKDLVKDAHQHALKHGETSYNVSVQNVKTGYAHNGKSSKTDWVDDVDQ